MLRVRVIRNDRRYRLIRPFWLEINVENFSWIRDVVFGKMFSNQIKSKRDDADFWLTNRFR